MGSDRISTKIDSKDGQRHQGFDPAIDSLHCSMCLMLYFMQSGQFPLFIYYDNKCQSVRQLCSQFITLRLSLLNQFAEDSDADGDP